MAVCKYCKARIPKGQGWQHPLLSVRHYFCNEEHGNLYYEEHFGKVDDCVQEETESEKPKKKPKPKSPKLSEKEKQSYRNLTDDIQMLYSPDEPNWLLWTSQIKKAVEDYGLTYKDIRGIIKYAQKFVPLFEFKPEYSLSQFIPKYIEPYFDYFENKQAISDMAESLKKPKTIVVKRQAKRKKYIPRWEE